MTRGRWKPGILPEGWVHAATHVRRSVCYFDESQIKTISEVPNDGRIYGPVSPNCKTKSPVIIWSERSSQGWSLRYYNGSSCKTILHSEHLIGTPSVTLFRERVYVAARIQGRTVVCDEAGSLHGEYPVKYPALCSDVKRLWLAGEQSVTGGIDVCLMDITDGNHPRSFAIHEDDLNLNVCLLAANGTLYLAFEARPYWGMDHCLSMTNALHLYRCEGSRPRPACCVPMPKAGFLESHGQFVQSIHVGYPRLFALHGQIILAARRFHCDGFRRNSWSTIAASFDGEACTPFGCIADVIGASDTAFSIVENGDGYAAFLPVFTCPGLSQERDMHAECWQFESFSELLPLPGPAGAHKAPYQIEMSAVGIARKPVPLRVPGYHYLTADLHTHSVYSKCMSSIDGAPAELCRWYLDLLKNDAICITDHLDRVAHPFYVFLTDRMEELAEGAAILYGSEPSVSPDHDTNFYTIDRTASDIARLAQLYSVRRGIMYRVLKKYLPKGSVGCFRHCHGRQEIHTQKTLDTWDSELEWGMEAVQIRGNILLGESHEMSAQKFPCNFLNHGCKIGLTGGTDHDLEIVDNRIGLTGFWVRDDAPSRAEGIFEAMKTGRTTAFSNGFVQIWSDIQGTPSGGSCSLPGAEPVSVHLAVSAPGRIHWVALLKDGELLAKTQVEADSYDGTLIDSQPGPGSHWYTAIACCESIFENTESLREVMPMSLKAREPGPMQRNEHSMAFTSPIYVTIPA